MLEVCSIFAFWWLSFEERSSVYSWIQIQMHVVNSFFDALLFRRQKFLYELNTSGKYFAFKEQLKVITVADWVGPGPSLKSERFCLQIMKCIQTDQ